MPYVVVLQPRAVDMNQLIEANDGCSAVSTADVGLKKKPVSVTTDIVYFGVVLVQVVRSRYIRLRFNKIDVAVAAVIATRSAFTRQRVVHRVVAENKMRAAEMKPIAHMRYVVVLHQKIIAVQRYTRTIVVLTRKVRHIREGVPLNEPVGGASSIDATTRDHHIVRDVEIRGASR